MLVTLGIAGVFALVACVYLSPHLARLWQQERLARRCRATRSLVLTYDDGPSPRLTPRLLDLLAEYGVRASFFAMGRSVPGNEALLDRLVAEGHELGCHSQEHFNAWKRVPTRGVADIRSGYRSLDRWVPANGPFRPPYGKLTLASWREVRKRGARIGWWTLVAGDTARRRRPPEEVSADLRRAGGGVVLMHDLDLEIERDEWVLAATRQLLQTAKDEGYAVRTLGELIAAAEAS